MTIECNDNEMTTINSIIEIKSDPYIENENEIYPWTLYISSDNETCVSSLYIYSDIVEPLFYSKLFEIIRKMNSSETLNVHINSHGGSVTTLVSFINVIQECKAKVIMYIDGFAESASAILAFAGDDIVVMEHAGIMFHNIHTASVSLQDSGRVKASIESVQSIYKQLLTNFCSKVLTKSDIKNIIERGAELYFTGKDIQKRLAKN